jgi:subtilisin-like proprotein convertase family protein
LVVEHVEVNVTLESTFRGTLAIQLRAPSGVVSRLQEFHHDNHKDITNWRYQSIFSWGESPKGEWTMTMISEHNSDATSRWAGYFLQVHTHKRDPLVGKPSDFEFREF